MVLTQIDDQLFPVRFIEYFTAKRCPLVSTSSVDDVFYNYQAMGLPLVSNLNGPLLCNYPVNPQNPKGDWRYIPGAGPQGAPAMDTRHQIDVVWPGDARWSLLEKSDGTASMARTVMNGIEYRDENGFVIDFDANWDIIINGRDFVYRGDSTYGCPSEASDFDLYTVGAWQYDVVLHELLHALGGHHFDANLDPVSVPHHSVMAGVNLGGHFGTERAGNPYDPAGPSCGFRVIPLADQLFLELAWPQHAVADTSPALFNWEYETYGGGARVVPVRWNESIYFLGDQFCPDDVVTDASDIEALEASIPSFTSGNVGTQQSVHIVSNPVSGAAGTGPFWNYGSFDEFGDGIWQFDGMFTPPSRNGNPWTLAGSPTVLGERMRVVTSLPGGDATYMPVEFTYLPACGYDEAPPGCCP